MRPAGEAQQARIGGFGLRQQSRDRAVLVSTHLMDDVALAADRVTVLAGGIVRWQGTVDELSARGEPPPPRMSAAEAGYLEVLGG